MATYAGSLISLLIIGPGGIMFIGSEIATVDTPTSTIPYWVITLATGQQYIVFGDVCLQLR